MAAGEVTRDQKYNASKKGKKRNQRYESTPERKAAKAKWARKARKKPA